MLELDAEGQAEALIGLQPRVLVALLHLHRVADAHKTLGRVLLLDAGGLNQEHEGRGAAVHDRHFASRQLDDAVVNPEAGHRRHQVLDGGDSYLALNQRAGHFGGADNLGLRTDFHLGGQVHAAEHDAGIRPRRQQGHEYFLTGMQSDAGDTDRLAQRALFQHL